MLPQFTLLNRRLRRLLTPAVAAVAALPEAERYCKHFTAEAHLWLLLLQAQQPPGISTVAWLRVLAEHVWRLLRFSG